MIGIGLVTSDLESSVRFYTQTLELKEVERAVDYVELRGKGTNSYLGLASQEDAGMDAGSVAMTFAVDNLDNIVQELKRFDVDVKRDNDDDGTQTIKFRGLNNELISLTTAPPPDMADDEEIETHINGLALKTDDVALSVNFYKALGLKEIKGWTYEDNEDNVGLQAGDMVIELLSTGWFETKGLSFLRFAVDKWFEWFEWFETKGLSFLRFAVDDLSRSVYKLEGAGVDVDVGDVNENGGQWAFFDGPDDIRIGLFGLDQVSNAETDVSSDENTERPSIGEKVRFWEEQDKINQALIPRVMEMHDIVTDLHKRTANINSQIAAAEARVLQNAKEQVQHLVDEAEVGILQKTREYVQNLVNEAEARVLKQVNDQLPNLVQREVSQAMQGIRRVAYVAVVLAALALLLILYLVVT